MVTKLFADRLAPAGIPVFEVRPGIIATDMTQVVHEKYQRMIDEGLLPVPRFGQPEDCADLVNQYGTYNIQPTADTENLFPLIAPGLPDEWKRMAIGKKDLENLQ